jgi:hypothetical protein
MEPNSVKMIFNCRESEWQEFLQDVIQLGRSQEDLDLLEWVIEDRIEGDMEELSQYWGGDPDRVRIFWDGWIRRLDDLQGEFLLREDYEKCARIQSVREGISGARSTP